MADFDDTQIQQFIQNWFQSDSDKQAKTGEKCWESLQKPENEAAKELAHTPLLLTFLCLVYDRSQNFPDNRSVLYRKALRILLEEWASEKRILRDEIYQGLHTELEEILLSEIAYTGFEADRLFFPQREIVQQIKTFLAGNLNAPQHLDGEKVLNAIAIQQGILVERAEDVFSFSHLTLQEYLTAQYIDDNRLINQLVSQHLKDGRWKEVFLLVAGLMRGGADELLLLMEKEAQNYIISPKLKDLLRWAEQATNGSPADLKPVVKRAIAYAKAYAIVYAKANAKANAKVNAKVYAIAYANAIANANPNANAYAIYAIAYEIASTNAKPNAYAINEAIKLAEELKQMQIFHALNLTTLIARLKALKAQSPDDNEPLTVRQKFVERILETWLNALNLRPELINLSEEEAVTLKNYFYANNLILQCKQAAVRVSPKTWEGIEERMLLPPNN
ncbi:NACHT domain-containing protein [Floridanema aerugineum]|uniref:NACHT domain-containing NTPase n=1 Tax=Floridaenema aerugineum BLCC-F46 TaxID=3153654 RepID=A0ABV4X7F4_9CYAN